MKNLIEKGCIYMEWFETVKGTVKKTATKAYEKSSQLLEITKVNFQISEAEAEIEKFFKELGMKLYEEYKKEGKLSEDVEAVCTSIDEKYEEIEKFKSYVADLKNLKTCENCNTPNSQDNNYCSKCGEKLSD